MCSNYTFFYDPLLWEINFSTFTMNATCNFFVQFKQHVHNFHYCIMSTVLILVVHLRVDRFAQFIRDKMHINTLLIQCTFTNTNPITCTNAPANAHAHEF